VVSSQPLRNVFTRVMVNAVADEMALGVLADVAAA
jgi:hypothetical protein